MAEKIQIDANTSLKLTPMLLNGKNYQSWSKSAIISLKGKEISELFLHGTDTSAKMWTAITKMFGKQNNFAHIFQIKHDIIHIKQNQKPITQYFGAMKSKWDELDVHQPETTDPEQIGERKNQDRIFQFLTNLDQSYEQVRQQILFGANLPSLESIVSLLEQEESRRDAMNTNTQTGDNSENQAFLSYNKPQNPTSQNNKDQSSSSERCECCKKTGHNKERCWFLHPHLRPKKWKRGGDRDGEKRKGEKEKKGYAAQ
ncbi:uncharacterized protein LOC144560267, partial [Carex rostrata]